LPEQSAEPREDAGSVLAGFVSSMFSPIDLLFLFFAVVTAFQVASRQSE
jgi:hypothetical protein